MAVEVMLAALKEFVIVNAEYHVKIAGGAALCPGISLAGNAQLVSMVHACRNFQLDYFFPDDPAFAVTRLAGILDNLARAVAVRAGTRDAEEPLLKADLAITIAGGTGCG